MFNGHDLSRAAVRRQEQRNLATRTGRSRKVYRALGCNRSNVPLQCRFNINFGTITQAGNFNFRLRNRRRRNRQIRHVDAVCKQARNLCGRNAGIQRKATNSGGRQQYLGSHLDNNIALVDQFSGCDIYRTRVDGIRVTNVDIQIV